VMAHAFTTLGVYFSPKHRIIVFISVLAQKETRLERELDKKWGLGQNQLVQFIKQHRRRLSVIGCALGNTIRKGMGHKSGGRGGAEFQS